MKKALIIIGVIVGIIVVLILVAPTEYHVERSVTIEASNDLVFSHLNSLKMVDSWAPWGEKDPNMTPVYEGPEVGVGSISSWEGNNDVGAGRQEITNVVENERVDLDLHFIRPWESSPTAYYAMEPVDEGTVKVTWGIDGVNERPMNVFGLFMSMDAAIGPEFEKGLSKLKSMAEERQAMAPKTYGGFEINETERAEQFYVCIKNRVPFADIANFFATNYGVILEEMGKKEIEMAGSPCGLYFDWDQENSMAEMAAAIPVAAAPESEMEGVEIVEVPTGKMLHIAYYGAYEQSENAHIALTEYMTEKEMTLSGPVIEEYVTDPGLEPDSSKWLTNIYYMVN